MAFDADTYKTATRQQWQDAAEAWNAWGGFLAEWLGPATEAMLDMAAIGPGCRVLDVAAGAGQQTLIAARRVGASGHVLATDIAPDILDYALENARVEGLVNVETLEADGENLEVPPHSFDAAISRVGLIYFPDQQRALANIMQALKPGGRFAAIVYSTPENNGFFSRPVSIIRERAELPPPVPGQPGPFSLGAPGNLTNALKQAGFRDVEERVINAPVILPTAADCLRFEQESFGALHQMLGGLGPDEQASVWREIGAALADFETADGFEGPCELVVAAGTK